MGDPELKTQNWLTDKELTDKFALGVSLAPTVRYAAAKMCRIVQERGSFRSRVS